MRRHLPGALASFAFRSACYGVMVWLALWAEARPAPGNQVVSAGLPVDQAFFDAYLSRTASVLGKVTMDDWNQL
ncbi:MAG: hypothetical protein MUC96_15825 [Myxococcaceae bacterium]|nr:hypothetical protein [Myxococcaceae bacterium]